MTVTSVDVNFTAINVTQAFHSLTTTQIPNVLSAMGFLLKDGKVLDMVEDTQVVVVVVVVVEEVVGCE
jgi:hypothetical protein